MMLQQPEDILLCHLFCIREKKEIQQYLVLVVDFKTWFFLSFCCLANIYVWHWSIRITHFLKSWFNSHHGSSFDYANVVRCFVSPCSFLRIFRFGFTFISLCKAAIWTMCFLTIYDICTTPRLYGWSLKIWPCFYNKVSLGERW